MPYTIKREEEIHFLAEASKILSSSLDYNTTLSSIAKLLVSHVADFCIIDLFENGRLVRVTVKVSDRKRQKLADKMFLYPPDPRNKGAIYDAARAKKPVITKKVSEEWLKDVSKLDGEHSVIRRLGLNSHIFAPLISRRDVIGVITIASVDPDFSYDREDAIFVQELAVRAAISVDKARLYKEAQDAIRERDEFLSIASHELKTPLTSILLNLQLILRKMRNTPREHLRYEDIIKRLESSEAQSNRLSRLIKDLLNVSVISTGRLDLEKEEINFNLLVKGVIERFALQVKKSHPKIKFLSKGQIRLKADKVRVEQVVINLLTNAIKYGNDEPITVKLERENGKAVLTVKDRGIGINKKYQESVFERFGRAVQTKDYKGLGVGLYIARQVVEAHGGRISLKSEEGRGSTFIVELPIRK